MSLCPLGLWTSKTWHENCFFKFYKVNIHGGWREGLFSQQAQGPGFDPQNPSNKARHNGTFLKSQVVGRWRQETWGWLANYTGQFGVLPGQRETLSLKKWTIPKEWHPMLSSVLHTEVHLHSPDHSHTKNEDKKRKRWRRRRWKDDDKENNKEEDKDNDDNDEEEYTDGWRMIEFDVSWV